MTDITITVTLNQETCFDSFMKFKCRENDISLEEGTVIEIANIDCKIIKKNTDGTYELMVQTAIVEKFLNCLVDSHEDFVRELDKLINIKSCKDEELECEFYLNKINYYHHLVKIILEKYNLITCFECKQYINLDKEHVKHDNKQFCNSDCKSCHEFATECCL